MAETADPSIERLSDWDEQTVRSLAVAGKPEGEWYDFKLDLPNAERLTKTCCAFANTRGGFLIFGVSFRGKVAEIQGVEKDGEFMARFHDRLRALPDVYVPDARFIGLSAELGLYVVEIPESPRKPHVPRTQERLEFYKRTSGGNEYMELRDVAAIFEDRRRRERALQNFIRELEETMRSAEALRSDVAASNAYGTSSAGATYGLEFLPEVFDLDVLTGSFSSLPEDIQQEPNINRDLSVLRRACRRWNLLQEGGLLGGLPQAKVRAGGLTSSRIILQRGRKIFFILERDQYIEQIPEWIKNLDVE